MLAMQRRWRRWCPPDFALVDGKGAPALPCPVRCVVGGDALQPLDRRRLDRRQGHPRPADVRSRERIPRLRLRAACRLRHPRAPGGAAPPRPDPHHRMGFPSVREVLSQLSLAFPIDAASAEANWLLTRSPGLRMLRGMVESTPNADLPDRRDGPHPRRRLRRADGGAAGSSRSMPCSPIRLIICSWKANCSDPTTAALTGSTTPGTIRRSRRLRRFTRAWLAAARRLLKPDGDALGDRQLPQHLPRRRDPPGPGLLDPQRHRLAQDQPDAELPRPALHQRARDADLVRARPPGPPPLQSLGDEER